MKHFNRLRIYSVFMALIAVLVNGVVPHASAHMTAPGAPAIHSQLLPTPAPANRSENLRTTLANDPALDPLNGNYTLLGENEIVLNWGADDGSQQSVFDMQPQNPDLGSPYRLVAQPTQTAPSLGATAHTASASGDFNGDGRSDLAFAAESFEGIIHVTVPQIAAGQLTWTSSAQVGWSTARPNVVMRLLAGDLDGDGMDEIVLGYLSADSRIVLVVFKVQLDAAGNPLRLTPAAFSASGPDYAQPLDSSDANFDIALGAVDATSNARTKQIVLAYVRSEPGQLNNNVTTAVYAFANGALTRTSSQVLPNAIDNGSQYGIAVATGNFDGDRADEIVLATGQGYSQRLHSDLRLRLLEPSGADLNQLAITSYALNRDMQRIALATGDFDGDGRAEIVFGEGENASLWYVVPPQLPNGGQPGTPAQIVSVKTGPNSTLPRVFDAAPLVGNTTYPYQIIIRDMDQNQTPDVVIAGSWGDIPRILVYSIIPGDTISWANVRRLAAGGAGPFTGQGASYSMAVGDFDGNSLHVGAPRHTRSTQVQQPQIILNAPPVHFDILNGKPVDVNRCYNLQPGAQCSFTATYNSSNTRTMSVLTAVSMDWGLDTSLTASAGANAIAGAKVEASLKLRYGEHFSKEDTATQIFSEVETNTTADDDLIFGTVTDYDIWEYPVYADGAQKGYLAVVSPQKVTTRAWYTSNNSLAGRQILADHENGNLLSYPKPNSLTAGNGPVGAPIFNSSGFTTGANQGQDWSVTYTNFTEQNVTTSKELGLEVGAARTVSAEFDLFGLLKVESSLRAEVQGHYLNGQISTHKTTVENAFSIQTHLGSFDRGIGNAAYTVTRYAYWGKNGALVLDYTVDPVGTWWEVNYGQRPDPAWSLPWRYYPEKGFALDDPRQRQLTKEITFQPATAQPGETVIIRARLHNYSLKDMADSLAVRFYRGDPAHGGVPLVGTGGETTVQLSPIPARGSAVVSLNWMLPPDFDPLHEPIYAVIDPQNTLSEIHEDNNTAYAFMAGGSFPPDGGTPDPTPNPTPSPVVPPLSWKVYLPVVK